MTRPAAQLTGFTVDIATRRGRRSPVVRALHDVDLTVHPGSVTALIGESGCGKSLVAAALCGLLPPGSRTEGRLVIDGDDFSGADERQWRSVRGSHIGLVPQSAATSFTPVHTIGAQLNQVCRQLNSDRSAAELLTAAHLAVETGSLYPHEISGGMAQRAAIAAAMAGRPELLVADEPTSALDPGHAAAVWELLAEVAGTGTGVLVITHDLDSLMESQVCREIALMREGSVICQEPAVAMTDSTDGYVRSFFTGALS
ncbi:MAG: ATP-binding cassette domain-containing protein [Mycobacterium sp.]